MTKRRVVVTKEDMILMLLNDDMDTPPEIHKFSPDAAKQLHAIGKLFFLGFTAHNIITHSSIILLDSLQIPAVQLWNATTKNSISS